MKWRHTARRKPLETRFYQLCMPLDTFGEVGATLLRCIRIQEKEKSHTAWLSEADQNSRCKMTIEITYQQPGM